VSEQPPLPAKPSGPPHAEVCLITGATGFIGGRLARRLALEGCAVRCLVRASSDTSRLDELDVQIVVGDLTSARSLARAVEGCRYVLHCGALVSDWATTQEIARTNVQGTRNLLEACLRASVRRFIHFSTTDVYGYPDGADIDETHAATRFRNWYAQTKLDAEAEVRRVQQMAAPKADAPDAALEADAPEAAAPDAAELEAVILRPATVYGPGSTDVIGEIARAIQGRHMLLVDRGRAIAGLCYVENLVDAALLALRHEAAPGHAFNVSDGLDVTWRQFTDELADGLGCARVRWSLPYWLASSVGFSLEHAYRIVRRTTGLSAPPLLSRQAVQVLGKNQDFSNRKARETLGWEPRIDYATGLQATIAWLTAEHLQATST
jgi:nucleoside-diphosphate-sugar epimerase